MLRRFQKFVGAANAACHRMSAPTQLAQVVASLRVVVPAALAILGVGVTTSAPAIAHPHVWIETQTEVVFAKGTVTGFKQRWTFDDNYTAMAIKGLDTNNDGTYSRAELQELAQINIDGLREFSYFTYARLGDEPLKNAAPQEYWLDHTNGKLTLVFFLPLADPVLSEAKGLTFSIFDPSFFIAFDMAETNPVRVNAAAPQGCGVSLQEADQQSVTVKRLQDALLSEFGGAAYDPQLSQTVAISCEAPQPRPAAAATVPKRNAD